MSDSYFHLTEKKSSVKIEVIAGIEKMDKQALIAATCLVSGISTIIVDLFANAPIAMAPRNK